MHGLGRLAGPLDEQIAVFVDANDATLPSDTVFVQHSHFGVTIKTYI